MADGAVKRYGCATQKWKSCRPARLPIVLETAVEVGAAQSDDGVGSADGPEQTGLFEPRTIDCLAASLNDAGADERVLAAERGIAHALGVVLEVVSFGTFFWSGLIVVPLLFSKH